MANERKIALLGQPNSGKSTVFNTLTGAHQHVGNWPGKTVEKVEGEFTLNGTKYLVADLPGTYSLSANSDEEIVTRDYIASGGAELTCILADASQLERSLFMLADYAGINTPAMLVLTIRIGGMRCENCRRSAEEALNALNGVSAKISLENKTARVDFEREISDEEIMDAIEAAGFEVLEIMR